MKIALAMTALLLGTATAHAADATPEITQASWGYAGERKDVMDDVVKLCANKHTCMFEAINDTFTLTAPHDPSPGNAKGLLVRWKCGEKVRRNQFAEGKAVTLTCD